MRFVVFGAGAIGGVVGARLHQAGYEVALIARGAHYRAIAAGGLRLEGPDGNVVLDLPVVEHPGAVRWREDDVVLLAVKTQDTAGALGVLADAAPPAPRIVCMQNGVENERLTARLFPNVYGAVVIAPTGHLEPGAVQAYSAPLTGVIDVGRYPSGTDATCATTLRAARPSTSAPPDSGTRCRRGGRRRARSARR